MELTRVLGSRQSTNPKTVLGFYGTFIAILVAGCVAAIAALAETHTMTYLIPWVLAFGGAIVVLLVAGVFAVTLIDPSRLMLGQISGAEYAEIHKLRLGDSDLGELEKSVLRAPTSFPLARSGTEPSPPPAIEDQE